MAFRLILCALMAATTALAAQGASAGSDTQSWGAVVATGSAGPDSGRLRYWIEGQGRLHDDSSRFGQGIVRMALGYKLGERAALWGGYAVVPTDRDGGKDDTIEHRIWQQLTWRAQQPLGGFTIDSRSRLEQRTVSRADDRGWRVRQLVKLVRPVSGGSPLYLSIWNELFVNLNSTDWGADAGVDQNRAFIGLGTRLAPTARFEAGYLNQLVDRDDRPDQHNHILSLTLLLSF